MLVSDDILDYFFVIIFGRLIICTKQQKCSVTGSQAFIETELPSQGSKKSQTTASLIEISLVSLAQQTNGQCIIIYMFD